MLLGMLPNLVSAVFVITLLEGVYHNFNTPKPLPRTRSLSFSVQAFDMMTLYSNSLILLIS